MLAPRVAAPKLRSNRNPKNKRGSAMGSLRTSRKAMRPTITKAARVAATRSNGRVDGFLVV